MLQQTTNKQLNRIKKEIEDYYKSWCKKNFQKGVRDARVYLGNDIIVIVGIDVLSFVEQTILDDQYSKQIVEYSRKKIVEKNYLVLRTNLELITGRRILDYYMDFSVDDNTSCMTIILDKETEANEKG